MENFKNYHLYKSLGKGGMAEVYLAEDVVLEKLVALKILPHAVSNDEHYQQRFLREIKLNMTLQHNNVVRAIGGGCHENRYYLAVEYVHGWTLGELIEKHKKLPVHIALYILDEVLKGLAYAHSEGVVHRDIKPSNIMISKDGAVKITDFGIFKGLEDSTPLTESGNLVGTPMYMSPEQVLANKVDPRSDLFSLGIVFYEMLTGIHPFKAENIPATMMHVVQKAPSLAIDWDQTIPWDVKMIVDRLLKKERDERFVNSEAVRSAIGFFIASELDLAEPEKKEDEEEKKAPPRDRAPSKVGWYLDKKPSPSEPKEKRKNSAALVPEPELVHLVSRTVFREFLRDPLQTVEKLNKIRSQTHFLRGENLFYHQPHRLGESLYEFHQAVLLDPEHFEAKVLLRRASANAAIRPKEDQSPQIAKLQESLDEDPQNFRLWQRLAKVHQLTGNFMGTLNCYRRLLLLRPKDVYIQNQIQVLLGNPNSQKNLSRTSDSLEAIDRTIPYGVSTAELDQEADSSSLRMRACPKCGKRWYYQYCPNDGTKLM